MGPASSGEASITGGAAGATEATGAALARAGAAVRGGRGAVAVLRTVVVRFVVVWTAGAAVVDASGSATVVVVISVVVDSAGAVVGAVGAGDSVTGSGAVLASWASTGVEVRARTAAIAVMPERVLLFL